MFRHRFPLFIVVVVAGSFAASFASAQTTLHVNDDASGVNDGSSRTNAFVDLQDALAAAQAVVIETVTVGNPGNAGEWSGESYGGYGPDRICGAVGYVYKIGRFEVTAAQYTEFLNAVAGEDTYRLYKLNMWSDDRGCKIEQTGSSPNHSYSVASEWVDRPVNHVSWGDAARFCNWLHNDQPTGAQDLTTTEDGSYYLNGAMTDAELIAVLREPEATWVIPSEDEWYKAAYHCNDGVTGNYFDYPTGNDSVPSPDLVDPDPGNNATFCDVGLPCVDYTIGSPYYRTEVGAHENSVSPYATFDQGGNVWEWNEAAVSRIAYPYYYFRGLRGGEFSRVSNRLRANWRDSNIPSSGTTVVGFRIAEVSSECGNGVPEYGEACDDGNTDDGDGCSSTCTLEDPGACCLPDDTCFTHITQNDCEGEGGTYAGHGTTCACPPHPSIPGIPTWGDDGADRLSTSTPEEPGDCCLPYQRCVTHITQDDCEVNGGTFAGLGTTCGCPPDPSVHGQPKMYWTDSKADSVIRANLDGTDVVDVVTDQPDANGIAIDTGAGKVYWAIHPYVLPQRIRRANVDGTAIEHVMVADAKDLALDSQQQSVYWVAGDAIMRADLDGSNAEVLVEAQGPRGIALDLTAGKMYWTDPSEDKIQRANLDGSNVEELVTSGLSAPYGIALDPAAGKMYWTDLGADKIQRANLDGSEVEDLIVTGLSRPYAIALDPLAGKMYWSDLETDEILRANLDGSNIETLVTSYGDLSRIALTDRDCNQNGVFDAQDIANETSADCDSNGVPDECQPDCDNDGTTDPGELPPCGTSPDCNENGVPDECEPGGLEDCNTNGTFDLCDIYAGTSGDCNGNAIPDDCDIDPSDPDGNGEVSSDDNGDGRPDECCFASSPEPERLDLPFNPESRKIRYVSFHAGDTGRIQAVRVTFMDLPVPYDTWNGVQLYVQEPEVYCENSGVSQPVPPATECPDSVGGLSQRTFWGATLGCDPWWDDWTQYDVVHVYHEGIVPGAVYDIQVVNDTCDPADESSYSDPYRATTSIWGDSVGDCTTVPCSPPDGITGIQDVTAGLDKWKNLPGNIQKVRGDVEGSPAGDHRTPDQLNAITDVTYCLGAFLGDTYPGPGFPLPRPPPVCP